MKQLGRFKPKDGGVNPSFSFDNVWVAIDGDKQVTIWDLSKGKQVASVDADGIEAFSPVAPEFAVTNGATLTIYVAK